MSPYLQAGFAGLFVLLMVWGIPWVVAQFRAAHKECQDHTDKILADHRAERKEDRAMTANLVASTNEALNRLTDTLEKK